MSLHIPDSLNAPEASEPDLQPEASIQEAATLRSAPGVAEEPAASADPSHAELQVQPESEPPSHHDWYWAPLLDAVGPELAAYFDWRAETGSIQTYEHRETYRFVHIDSITREFFNQQRLVITPEAALAHALPRPATQALAAASRSANTQTETAASTLSTGADQDRSSSAPGELVHPEEGIRPAEKAQTLPESASTDPANPELVLGGFIRQDESGPGAGLRSSLSGLVSAVRKRIRPQPDAAAQPLEEALTPQAENTTEPSVSLFIRRTSKLER